MVKLTKIYTKTGDDGTTGLVGGIRIRKDAARVEAYGAVDEANAAIGRAVLACRGTLPDIAELLAAIQQDLFDLGADLATPVEPGEQGRLRITPAQTERLERAIDLHNADLPTLNSFVLPGGSPPAAELHLARTITRRAERRTVTLLALEPQATSPEPLRYLNRLSDLLFVLGRVANTPGRGGPGDVLWVPGKNR
jgi:cob(I)alamin adenosyltransferase